MVDKRLSLKEAIAEYVQDGHSLAIEGFTAFIHIVCTCQESKMREVLCLSFMLQ
jgi:acyl CoA:acetate/3-ketoacid CoA transferase alpha subunit